MENTKRILDQVFFDCSNKFLEEILEMSDEDAVYTLSESILTVLLEFSERDLLESAKIFTDAGYLIEYPSHIKEWLEVEYSDFSITQALYTMREFAEIRHFVSDGALLETFLAVLHYFIWDCMTKEMIAYYKANKTKLMQKKVFHNVRANDTDKHLQRM